MRQNQNDPSGIPSSLIEQINGLPEEKQIAIRLLIQNLSLIEKMMENDTMLDGCLPKYEEKAAANDDYFFQALLLYKKEKAMREKERQPGNEACEKKERR